MSTSQRTDVPGNDSSDAEAQNCPRLSNSDDQQQQPKQEMYSANNLQDVNSDSSADSVGLHRDGSAETLGDNLSVCKRRKHDEVLSPIDLSTSLAQAGNEDFTELTDLDSYDENLILVKEQLEKDISNVCPIHSDSKHSMLDFEEADANCSSEVDLSNTASNGDCGSGNPLGTLEASDVESNFATIDISDSLKISVPSFETSQVTKSAFEVGESGSSISYSGQPLRDCWHSLFEIRQRETGYRGRQHGTCAFTHRACGSVHLVQRLVRYTTLNGHSGCVNALHFNDSGTLLASGSDDLNIQIWNWMESKSFFHFDSGHRSNVFQCKFMPYTGDCHLVSCARDGQVRLAELSSTGACRVTKKLAHHKGAAHKLALLSDSSHVFYSCGEDAVSFEVDLRQEKPNKLCVTRENNHKIELYSIHANPFKPYEFVVGGRDYYVRVYDARNINENENGGVLKKFCPQHLVGTESKANITCAVYNFDGTEILGSYNDEEIYLFDNTQPEVKNHHLHQYTGHRNSATVKGVNFYGPKSEFIVSGSDCGNVFLWEKNSEKIVNYFKADEGSVVNVLEPHPHFAFLATSGLDHDVKIWLPLAEEPTQLTGLDKLKEHTVDFKLSHSCLASALGNFGQVIKKNRRERENERNEPDIDNRMLWLLMHHLRRSARRQMQNLGEERGTSSSEESEDMENDDDDDEEEDGGEADEPMQCNPS